MKGLAGAALAAALLVAAPVATAAQQTREEIAAEQRRAKSRELRPSEPGRVERTMLKLSDERMLDRVLNPRRGLFVRVGLPTEGASFGAGPGWRASDPGRRYTLTASAAASISREWLGELALQVPDVLPGLGNDRFFADVSVSRSGRVENEFWGLGNDSPGNGLTVFRVAQTAVGGTFGVRLTPALSVEATASRLAPGIKASGEETPSITDRFDESTAPGLTRQPPFFLSGIGVDLDYRESIPPARTAVRLDRVPLAGAARGGRYQVTLTSVRRPGVRAVFVPTDHDRSAAVRAAATRPSGAGLSGAGGTERRAERAGGAVLLVADVRRAQRRARPSHVSFPGSQHARASD